MQLDNILHHTIELLCYFLGFLFLLLYLPRKVHNTLRHYVTHHQLCVFIEEEASLVFSVFIYDFPILISIYWE